MRSDEDERKFTEYVAARGEAVRRIAYLVCGDWHWAAPGTDLAGADAALPAEAVGMVGRIGPVEAVGAAAVLDASVYRNDHVPAGRTSSVAVLAADPPLAATVGASVRAGSWLAAGDHSGVVLGSDAARRLDVPGSVSGRCSCRRWAGSAARRSAAR